MTQVELWCTTSFKCALVEKDRPVSRLIWGWRNQLRCVKLKWKGVDSACKMVYYVSRPVDVATAVSPCRLCWTVRYLSSVNRPGRKQRQYGWKGWPIGHPFADPPPGGPSPGPNLTKVGTSPTSGVGTSNVPTSVDQWGRPTSPLQWTNGDGSRWRLSAGGATCRRTAAASAWMGQGSYEGAVAMRVLSFKSRTQQMSSYAECIACIVTAPLLGPGCCCCSTWSVQLQWRHLQGGATWHAPPVLSPLHCDSVEVQNLIKIQISTTQEQHSLTIFNDVTWTGIKEKHLITSEVWGTTGVNSWTDTLQRSCSRPPVLSFSWPSRLLRGWHTAPGQLATWQWQPASAQNSSYRRRWHQCTIGSKLILSKWTPPKQTLFCLAQRALFEKLTSSPSAFATTHSSPRTL